MKLQLLIVLIVFLAIIKPVIADQGNSEVPTVTTSEDGKTITTKESADTTGATNGDGMSHVPEGSTVKNSFKMPNGMAITTWIMPDGGELTTTGPVVFTKAPSDQTAEKSADRPETTKKTNSPIITNNANGSTTVEYPDGTITMLDNDGSKITKNPDGSITTEDPSGFITTEYADGSTANTTKKADGSTVTVKSDGSKIIKKADGLIITINTDGSIDTKNVDGSTTTIMPDDTVTTKKLDGSVIAENADGSIITENADGSTITRNPDGSAIVKDAKGLTLQFGAVPTTKNSDGSTTMVNSDGSTIIQNTDGSATVKDAKGSTFKFGAVENTKKVIYSTITVNADGSITALNADGSIVTRNPDGSITAKDTNGSIFRFPDITVRGYPNGTIAIKTPDGSITTRNPGGLITNVRPDGLETTSYTDCECECPIKNADGSYAKEDDDGSIKVYRMDDGTGEKTGPTNKLMSGVNQSDLNTEPYLFNGTFTIYPDGTEITENPDGSTLTRDPSGLLTVNAGGGSEIMCALPMPGKGCQPVLEPLKKIKEEKSEEISGSRIKITKKYEDGSEKEETWYKDGKYTRTETSADGKTITERDRNGDVWEIKKKEGGRKEQDKWIRHESWIPCKPSRCHESHEPSAPEDKKTPDTTIGKVPVEYPNGKTPHSTVQFKDIPQPRKN